MPKPVAPELVDPTTRPITFDTENSDPVKLAGDLSEWLKGIHDPHCKLEILVSGNMTLGLSPEFTGLIAHADRVTIRPKVEGSHPTIQLTYIASTERSTPSVALTVRANSATITGIRFLVDARLSEEAAPMIGLQFEGGGTYEVSDCEFVQANVSEKNRLSSLVAAANGKQATLKLSKTDFLGYKNLNPGETVKVGGQNAISRQGAVALDLDNCAFGPHTTMFRLEGRSQPLSLRHCSFMMGAHSTAFQLMPDTQIKLTAEHCLFARHDASGVEGDDATLIRLSKAVDEVDFSGSADNGYFNLNAFLAGPDGNKTTLAEFRSHFGMPTTDTSRVLDSVPFRDDQALASRERPLQAFRPYLDWEDLRQGGDRRSEHLIGVEVLDGESLTAGLPLAEKRAEPAISKKRYVDTVPDREDSKRGIYSTLFAAVNEAKPGDTVYILHNGPLPEKTIRLEKPTVDLTIKPGLGCRPILTLDTTDREASLFRLHGGKLQLEGLEIVIRPRGDAVLSQSVLTLVDDGQVTFKDCVVTLDQAGFKAPLAVATLPDPRSAMKMEPMVPRIEAQKAHLTFVNCFVRGTGDFIWNQTGRLFDLDVSRSLIAVSGSLCNVELGVNTVGSDQRSVLKLERTTTFLGGNLLRVQGRDVKDLTKVPIHQIVASECLFQPKDNGVPLVRYETQDSEGDGVEEKLKSVFLWDGKTNAFGVFEPLLTHWQIGETEQKLDLPAWRKFSGASDPPSKYRVPLVDLTARDTPLRELKPAQLPPLRPASDSEFGADTTALQKLLPAVPAR